MKFFAITLAIMISVTLAKPSSKNDWPCPAEGVDLNWTGDCDITKIQDVPSWKDCAGLCRFFPECNFWTLNTISNECIYVQIVII